MKFVSIKINGAHPLTSNGFVALAGYKKSADNHGTLKGNDFSNQLKVIRSVSIFAIYRFQTFESRSHKLNAIAQL